MPALAVPENFAEELQDRIDRSRASAAFRTYLAVREEVLRLKDEERRLRPAGPSAYWREELANFEYMLDASPLVVEKLRHHTFHVTGIRVYEYRSNREHDRARMAAKLEALHALGGDHLLVSESPELGGFGFDIDGRLVNLDTLKFFEVLIALRRGGVLGELEQPGERRLVWEIGAGWGGFAYQLKSLLPHVTYVITDFPELFLFSAVYLKTLLPEARVLFLDRDRSEELERWGDYDFVFTTPVQLDLLRLDRLDLALNMVSFQEMTADQVREYVDLAADQGAAFLYSLNRDRSPYNPELESVRDIIAERFWPRPVPMLPVSYPELAMPEPGLAGAARRLLRGGPSPLDYRHIVGIPRAAP
jgi:putative sugar O-methyltransferase